MNKLKVLLLAMVIFGCEENTQYLGQLNDPELVNGSVKQLTNVIVYDIFSPPVASRIYAYASVAGYEAMLPGAGDKFVTLAGQLNGLKPAPAPDNDKINYHLASVHAFLKVGTALIFSEQKMLDHQANLYQTLEMNGLPDGVKDASIQYGDKVAAHILAWANEDMYMQTRTYPKYTVPQDPFMWKPTPPDYMEGIEPHWNKIRTMVLDSAAQFPPVPPHPLSMDKNSEFYKQLKEVYDVRVNLTNAQTDIAKFWDCNPYVSHHLGHAMFATKKITPGGHWIGITAIANRMAGSNFEKSMEAYARVSVSLFDAFISCWNEKWRSIVVRPETLINEFMDEEWMPLLQTPPFPEYTSGHSVVSRAAAITLTDFYGDHMAFNDTTENEYGLVERKFESFLQASEEAAISRLYGGIHYMMAIENGVDQGEKVGKWVVANVKTSTN